MRNQRSFSPEFKRQAVEELLTGESQPAYLFRRYNISASYFTTRRSNIAGASSIASLLRKQLLKTG